MKAGSVWNGSIKLFALRQIVSKLVLNNAAVSRAQRICSVLLAIPALTGLPFPLEIQHLLENVEMHNVRQTLKGMMP